MLILFSPTKQMNISKSDIPELSGKEGLPFFQEEALSLNSSLSRLSTDELMSVMKISSKIAEQTRQSILDFNQSEKGHALFSYKGTSFQSLDAETLSVEALHYGQSCLRVLSAMYGILQPFDLINQYRLEMKAPLNPEGKGTLQTFWKKRLSPLLKGGSPIINLASSEYIKALDSRLLKENIINIHFKEQNEKGLRTVGMYAKMARGAMLRVILEEQIRRVEDIQKLVVEGYRFHKELSDQNNYFFVR